MHREIFLRVVSRVPLQKKNPLLLHYTYVGYMDHPARGKFKFVATGFRVFVDWIGLQLRL